MTTIDRRKFHEAVKAAFEAGYCCGAEDPNDRLDDPTMIFWREFEDAKEKAERLMQ